MLYTAEEQNRLTGLSKQYLSEPAGKGDIAELRAVIIFHEHKYYIEDNPVISDFEYDQLYKQLVKLEETYPDLVTPDSPTQRVSVDITGEFKSVPHTIPMLSLDNSYNEGDLLDFDNSVKKLCGLSLNSAVEYCVEPKFDGGSIAIIYEKDLLTRAATRGNGIMGEEMTANARSIPSIPLKASFSNYKIRKVELRGEALIRKDRFSEINAEREREGLSIFANPRNAATGGLRMKDPNETRRRGLEAFIYQLAYAEDAEGNEVHKNFKTHYEGIELLGALGFKIPHYEMKVCKNIIEVIDYCHHWQEKRDNYPYEIDGMVIKVNSLELQAKCGFTAHHPRWAVAFKFKAKQATSRLLKVEYQVGKVGSITPVAKIEPVHLAGVTVSSISLHNEDFIRSKDLRIGDTVLVERAGDVIPYIVKAMEELRTGKETVIEFPEFCPVNDTDKEVRLIQLPGEAAWRCPSCVCGKQNLEKIIFHVSKDAMDIDGFGKSYVEKFMSLGWIRDMSDVYHLDYDAIAGLEGFGKKSAENLKSAVEKAKKNPIHRLLHSLSIHHLGKKASKLIAEQIGHIMELREWPMERFLEIKDIGPVVAENVRHWFDNTENIKLLEKMESYGVNLKQTEDDKPLESASTGILAGKTMLFTGTLTSMGRKEAEILAAKHGAKILSAVSSNLNILVVGENAGSKLKKAKELGTVDIMTEEEFIAMVNNNV